MPIWSAIVSAECVWMADLWGFRDQTSVKKVDKVIKITLIVSKILMKSFWTRHVHSYRVKLAKEQLGTFQVFNTSKKVWMNEYEFFSFSHKKQQKE